MLPRTARRAVNEHYPDMCERLLPGLRRLILLLCALCAGCGALPWASKPAPTTTAVAVPTIKLAVHGVGDRLAGNIRAHVSLASRACATPAAYLSALAKRAEEEAQDALRAYGYYHASVKTRVQRDGDCPRVAIEVYRERGWWLKRSP